MGLYCCPCISTYYSSRRLHHPVASQTPFHCNHQLSSHSRLMLTVSVHRRPLTTAFTYFQHIVLRSVQSYPFALLRCTPVFCARRGSRSIFMRKARSSASRLSFGGGIRHQGGSKPRRVMISMPVCPHPPSHLSSYPGCFRLRRIAAIQISTSRNKERRHDVIT